MLCEHCETVFKYELIPSQGKSTISLSHTTFTSWSEIESRAIRCYICQSCVCHKQDGKFEIVAEDQCHVTFYLHIPADDAHTDDQNPALLQVWIGPGEDTQTSFAKVHFRLYGIPVSVAERIPEARTSSTNFCSSFAFARECFSKCSQQHIRCSAGRSVHPHYPNRLVHIQRGAGIDGDADISIRLIDTRDSRPAGPYCALSHCWGKLEIHRLLKSNIWSMKENIGLQLLPQTFLDAIRIAWSLDIQYIWIDSLCIIQDSEADWQKEASMMTAVYRWATLNIAATKAVDGSEGLFAERNWSNTFAVVILKQGEKKRAFQIFHRDYWEKVVNDAPLNRRAWVVQERMLSPRTLHFTRDQLIWDCCEELQLESSRHALKAWSSVQFRSLGPKRNYHFLSGQRRRKDVYNEWLVVMRIYSRSLLTYPKDKHVALLGLFGLFDEILKDEYFVGFWKESMIFHLSWYNSQTPGASPGTRNSCAPSWSWLSFDGQIEVPLSAEPDHKYETLMKLAEVLSVNLTKSPLQDGRAWEGHLVLRAAITPLSHDEETNTFSVLRQIFAPFINEATRLSCTLDYKISTSAPATCFSFVPLWARLAAHRTTKFNDHCEIHGLVVRRTQEEPPQHERCGHGCLITSLSAPLEGVQTYLKAVEAAQLCRENLSENGQSLIGGAVTLV